MTRKTVFTLPARSYMDPIARSILRRHLDRLLFALHLVLGIYIIHQLTSC